MPGSILDTIVLDVRQRLAAKRRLLPLSELENRPLFASVQRSLNQALRSDGLSIIAEIKKASPSQGVIREDFDPVKIALQYANAGAEAISILTEPNFFQGDVAFMEQIVPLVDVPILRKDFIVDPYQLFEAKAFGADAVLLIVNILSREQLAELCSAAAELELDCLVEVYAEKELEKVDFDQISILGVNNRDLDTFEVDPGHAARVFTHVPDDLARVAESGLKTAQDLAQLSLDGIDAALIGETFMRSTHPGICLSDLRTSADLIVQNTV